MIVKLKERLSFLKQLQYNVLDNHMNSLAIKNILKVKIKNLLVKNIERLFHEIFFRKG